MFLSLHLIMCCQIETFLNQLKWWHAMVEFFLFHKERSFCISLSFMLLFMLHWNKCSFMFIVLVRLFTIMGLQPWALVAPISAGQYNAQGQRKKRIISILSDESKSNLLLVLVFFLTCSIEIMVEM